MDFSLSQIVGYNDTDSPIALPPNQAREAVNVEFNLNVLGGRRRGCRPVDVPVSISGDVTLQAVTFLHRHIPGTDPTAAELWVLAQNLTTQNYVLTRKTTTWATISASGLIDVTNGRGFTVAAQSLNGKLFLAFNHVSNVNRLWVYDGSSLRPTGLAQPAAPVVTDDGLAGTYTTTRYIRVRYIVMSGTTILRRSEPSTSTTFVPLGTNTGANIARPALLGEGETHWEIEASLEAEGNYYLLATELVATTSHHDTTDAVIGYSAGDLSEDIGDYSLIHMPEFLLADEDRLLVAGGREDSDFASRISWTPRKKDPGKGNNERIPLDIDSYTDLNNKDGGGITGFKGPVNGYIYAFKLGQTYRLARTSKRQDAYEAIKISDKLGALKHSIVEGVDQLGMPCLYFLDPVLGPCRTGGNRIIQSASRDILNTWRAVNKNATIVTRALYYPESRQVHWWLASDEGTVPNLKLVLQTNYTRETEDGIRNGWSQATGKVARAYTACLFAENIDDGVERSLELKPLIGVSAADGWILCCDEDHTDDSEVYYAHVTSKAFSLAPSILDQFGVEALAIAADANASARLYVSLQRDFKDYDDKVLTKSTLLTPENTESHVVKQFDNLGMSELYALQIRYGDDPAEATPPQANWEMDRLDLKFNVQTSK